MSAMPRLYWALFVLGLEVFFASSAGQAQHAVDQPFRILSGPEYVMGVGWRIGWESQAGRTYVLQRWTGDDLSVAVEPRWQDVARVTATGARAEGEDPDTIGTGRRYYRVALLPPENEQIRIVGLPDHNGLGWSLTWTSVPGGVYALERWASDDLNVRGEPAWVEVARFTATAMMTSGTDPGVSASGQRYYRVARVGNNVVPPQVSAIQATDTTLNGQPAVRLAVTVSEELPIDSVAFLDGEVELGEATLADGLWALTVPVDLGAEIRPYFIARAVNTLGRAGYSPVLRYGPAEVNRFAVVDANGQLTGEFVEADEDGTLPPFEYRPTGRSSMGSQRELTIHFPGGARLVVEDGLEYIEFEEAELTFGAESPMQFLETGGAVAAVRRLGKHDGTKRIPVGPLAMEVLAEAMGFDPEVGIPVIFFDKFPMLWRGGTLVDYGIRDPQFQFLDEGTPLPAISGGYPDYRMNLLRDRNVRLPFTGRFELEDGSGTPVEVNVPLQQPVWVTMTPEGQLRIRGQGEVQMPGGGYFRGAFRFDDPFYRFHMLAESVHLPILGSLTDLLPPDPQICVPALAGPEQLATAADCLRSHARAYANFSASALALTPAAADGTQSSSPPSEFDTVTSMVEAWIYAAITPGLQSLPVDQIRTLLRQIGQSASGSRDVTAVLRYQMALLRVKRALAEGALQGSAEATEDLESALAEAEAAALSRAQQPDAMRNLDDMREASSLLVELAATRQALGLSTDDLLTQVVPGLFQAFALRHLEALGVRPGEFTSAANPVIGEMNRFVVYEHLSKLVGIMGDLAALGMDASVEGPLDEALSQLALRLHATATISLNDAETAEDVPGFTYAMADLLDLLAMRDLALFPDDPALNVIPATGSAGAELGERLNGLLELDLAKPRGERSFINIADEIRRLLRILQSVPATVTFASPPITRVHDFMQAALSGSMATVPANVDLIELLELLEGGTLHARLARQFALPLTRSWENERLPIVAARLATVAVDQRGWSALDEGARLLIAEADRLVEDSYLTDVERSSLRLAYVQQAAELLQAAREVAAGIWQSEDSRRAQNPALFAADMLLPGDILVDRAAGSAWYDRSTRTFGGSFRGQVRLPKISGSLTVLKSSFDSGGAFDLSCYGTVGIPGGQVTVSPRYPLRLSYDPTGDLRIAGAVRVALDNGIRFGGHLILEDPLYGFGMEAQGLRFDLANELTVLRPTLDEAAVAGFSNELRRALNAYQSSLNATLEALLNSAADLPLVEEPAAGEVPEFNVPQVTLPFEELNAWANGLLFEAERGVNVAYDATAVPAKASLHWLNQQAADARQALDSEARVLDNQLRRAVARRRATQAMTDASTQALLGNDDIAGLLSEAEAGLKEEVLLHAQLLRPESMQDLGEALKHVLVLLNLADSQQLLAADFSGLQGPGVPDDPAVPASGPCRDVYEATDEPLIQAVLLLECARLNYFPGLGLDPTTGAVIDAARLNLMPEYELQKSVRILVEVEVLSQQFGIESPAFGNALQVLNRRWHEVLLQEYDQTPPANKARRLELARLLGHSAAVAANLGDETVPLTSGASRAVATVKGMSQSELDDLDRAVTEQLNKRQERLEREVVRDLQQDTASDLDDLLEATTSRGLLQDLGIFLTVLFEQTGEQDQVYLDKVSSFVRFKARRMRDRSIDPEYLSDRLHDGRVVATDLADLTSWAVTHMADDVQFAEDLRFTLQNTTVRFTSVAEARRAWWLIGRYAELLNSALLQYGDRMSGDLRLGFEGAWNETLLAADRVTGAFAELLGQVELESLVFKLPGDLLVRNVFGSVLYRRDTELLTGRFGGRLEFPEINTFFEIHHAALASDGTFSIAARSGGPLPFGSGITAEAAITAAGAPSGALAVSGSGELHVPSDNGVQTYAVTVGYNTVTRLLSFDSEVRDLNLQFTEDFVLYGAGLGFEVSTAQPAGRLVISGSAGLVAKEKPLPATIVPELFHVNVLDTSVSAELETAGFAIALERGTVQLPAFFHTELCEGGTNGLPRPSAILRPDQPLFVAYQSDPEQITFGGRILFTDLGFEVPGIEGLKVSVCTANLTFENDSLPVLSDLTASIQIPLPNQSLILDVENVGWGLNGFPTGTIQLRENLALFEAGGFRLDTLGSADGLCPEGTAMTLATNNGQPVFRVDGGMRFTVPAGVLTDASGGELFAAFCAGLDFGPNLLPLLELNTLEIGSGGEFRLGGPEGLLIHNARLQAEQIQNLFDQAPDRPFILTLSGGFAIPDGPGFALQNARFTFDGGPFPRFSLGGATLSSGDSLQELTGLPIQVTSAGFAFKDPNLPIDQLFAPENVVVTLSASLALPPEAPVITGQVQNLVVTVVNGVPQVSISGIGLGIEDFEVPPLSLSGQVFIGGLGPGEDIYFAGVLGGTLQGAGVKALAAFNLYGPLGICFSVNAGPAGIPLGPTGFLFTGAEGGVSFVNTNGDPCEFQTYLNLGPDGVPLDNGPGSSLVPQSVLHRNGPRIAERHVMTWQELRLMQERHRIYEQAAALRVDLSEAYAENRAITVMSDGEEFPCPTGDCPPATINILCQAHPDLDRYADRVIVKFSSLDESFMNGIGITREFVESLGLTTAEGIAAEIAPRLTDAINAITPRPDPAFTGPNGEPIGAELNQLLDELMAGIELAFQGGIQAGVQAALGDSDSVYEAILEAAYAGVRCPDATVKLTGTFSHAAVSSFLSGTGGTVLSTTGSAGLVGTVNLFGIPVGFLDGFVNATDANGDPNPSMCGEVRFALGPLELGQLKMLNQCEGCVTGVLAAFGGLGNCLADDIFNSILPKVAPQLVGVNKSDALQLMTDDEKLAFLAEWFSLPPSPGAADCFVNLMVDVLGSINPEFTACGAVQPKLFGFPLAGSAIEVAAAADKTSMAGQFGFSSALLLGPYAVFFPIADQASFGFGVAWPNPDDLVIGGLTGRFNSPEAVAAYVEEGFAHVLANATYTVGFELSAFGMKGFQSGARVVMPNLVNHPEVSGWVAPENRGLSLPSRLELMIAAVENEVLDNPLWKGTAEDIHLAFTENDPRRAQVEGLSFAEDYFPHGGIVGAARIGLPRAIIEAPPESLLTLINPETELIARLGAGLDYIQNYVLDQTEVGTLGFYVPAPNPPLFTDGQGQALGPRELLNSIMQFDPALGISTDFYPLHAAFLQGYLEGQLLGIPIARAQVLATPPTEAQEGQFLIATEIPPGSWMQQFVDSAGMTFEIRQAPVRSIEDQFAFLAETLQQLIVNNASDAEKAAFLDTLVAELQSGLPKMNLDLTVNHFRIPAELASVLQLDGSTTARLVAYTPQFDPESTGQNPMSLVRRQGGMAIQAQLRFADLITINNAELAVFPGQLSLLTGLPAMAGQFDVPLLPVGLNVSLQDVSLAFNSEPAIGAAYIDASGGLEPLQVGPLLRVIPLNSQDDLLSGTLRVIRSGQPVPTTLLSIDPAQIQMPIFGPDLRVLVHGASPDQPFTFSTEDAWAATVRLEGGLELSDAFGLPIVRVGAPDQNVSAAFSGEGLQSAALALDLPPGIVLTAFPGQNFAREFVIGAAGNDPARLVVSSDGTFEISGRLDGALVLPGASIGQINSGAEILLNNDFLRFTGTVSGGTLDELNTGSATASVTFTKEGAVQLAAEASVPPLQFDRFRISGIDGGNLAAVLDHESLRISSGARFDIQGIAEELFTLGAFEVLGNGDFVAQVAAGRFVVPGYFMLSEGSASLSRSGGITTFEMTAPRLTVFPGAEFEGQLPSALEQVLIESTGRFYYNSGQQLVGLPGTFSAAGQLEFGYEPDGNAPQLGVATTPIQFGDLNVGQSATRTLRVGNVGGSQLLVAASAAATPQFTVTPTTLTLAPGDSADLTVRFSPNQDGTASGLLTLNHNTATSPTVVSLSGQGRIVPIYYQSQDILDFGEQPLGGGSLRQLLLSNLGQAPLEIDNITLSGPFVTATTPFTIPPGQSHRLFVTFRPEAIGEATGTLQLEGNDDPGSHAVELRGAGTQLRWYTQRDAGSNLRSIDMRDTSTGIAVGDNGTLLTTVNTATGGLGWTPRHVAGGIALYDVALYRGFPFRAWAVGNSGLVLTTSDFNLVQWIPVTHPQVAFGGNEWRGVSPWQPNRLMIVGRKSANQSVIVRQTSDQDFEEILPGTTAMLNAVSCLFEINGTILNNGVMAIAVGNNGTILRSGNNGINWNSVALPPGVAPNATLRDVVLYQSGLALIAGDGGTLLRSTDFGLSWTRLTPPAAGFSHLYRVTTDGSRAWISGQQGLVLRSDDAGLTWQSEGTTAGNRNLLGLAIAGEQVWTSGVGGHIQHRPVQAPAGPRLTVSTAFVDFGTVPLGTTRRHVLTLHNRGTDRLDVSQIIASGPGISVGEESLAIEPGASRLLTVTSHATELTAFDPPPGQPNGIIRFVSNDPAGDLLVALRARTVASAWVRKPGGQDFNFVDVRFPTALVGYAIHEGGVMKTIDGGETWTTVALPTLPGPLLAIHFNSSTAGWVGGGNPGSPFILRTTNGGGQWSFASIPANIRGAVTGISFPPGNSTIGYAITDRYQSGQINEPGLVLRTASGGASWADTITAPDQFLSGSAIQAYSSAAVYVASGGVLFRTTDSGASWQTQFNLGGAYPIRTIAIPGTQRGFVGGFQGLLRRTEQSAIATPAWTAPAVFSHGHITSLHFINENTGWCVANGVGAGFAGSFIFRTEDGGLVWREDFATDSLRIEAIHGLGTAGDSAYAVGYDGALLKYEPFAQADMGEPALPAQMSFGNVVPGQPYRQLLSLRNVGTAPLIVKSVSVNNWGETEPFAVPDFTPALLQPGEVVSIPVDFASDQSGLHRAELTMTTDGEEVRTTTLSATVDAPPRVAIIDTFPSGLEVLIDGVAHTTPVAFTVSVNADPSHWAPGSSHTLVALDEQTRDGIDYLFKTWEPAADREWNLVVPNADVRFVAEYVAATQVQSLPPPIVALGRSDIGKADIAPDDVPVGPWLRLSNGQIQVPSFGNLDMQGAVFLSAGRIQASLQSGSLRIPENPDQPGLLEVNAGSWLLDFLVNSHLRLRAANPGVKLLDTPSAPPSQFDLVYANNGDFEAAWTTLDDLALVPGVLEFGPSSVTVSRQTFVRLAINGEARLLKRPDGQWSVVQPLDFEASEGPFTYSFNDLPQALLGLGFVAIGTDTSSALHIQRSSTGVFSIGATNLRLDVFGRSFTSLSGSADSNGLLTLTATPSTPTASPFIVGPFRLHTTQNSQVRWNVRLGTLQVNLAPSQLKAPGVQGWPANGVAFPGFQINSAGDFNRRILLPSFDFDGIALGGGSNVDLNYLRLRRLNGLASLTLQHQQDFFGNANQVQLHIDSAGQVNGSFYGSFLGASILMNYDSSVAPYQFQTRSSILGVGYSLYFGAAGARYCQLVCGIGQPLEDCAEVFCVP